MSPTATTPDTSRRTITLMDVGLHPILITIAGVQRLFSLAELLVSAPRYQQFLAFELDEQVGGRGELYMITLITDGNVKCVPVLSMNLLQRPAGWRRPRVWNIEKLAIYANELVKIRRCATIEVAVDQAVTTAILAGWIRWNNLCEDVEDLLDEDLGLVFPFAFRAFEGMLDHLAPIGEDVPLPNGREPADSVYREVLAAIVLAYANWMQGHIM